MYVSQYFLLDNIVDKPDHTFCDVTLAETESIIFGKIESMFSLLIIIMLIFSNFDHEFFLIEGHESSFEKKI